MPQERERVGRGSTGRERERDKCGKAFGKVSVKCDLISTTSKRGPFEGKLRPQKGVERLNLNGNQLTYLVGFGFET